eukprot:6147692-Pyramimonas_sp.AAC.2
MSIASERTCIRLVRRENIPALPASDWSVVRIYPRVQSNRGVSEAAANGNGASEASHDEAISMTS